MFVADLRHFLDLRSDTPTPARRMAEHLTLIVRAATAGDAGLRWVSALTCQRRPGHRVCPGHLAVFRTEVPTAIEWHCTSCGDEGVINGWEGSPFDLRSGGIDYGSTGPVRAVISSEVAATLRGLQLVDSANERLLFRASLTADGIVLAADEDDLDELIGYVAAEANHEEDRRRQKRLAAAFEVLNDALQRAHRS